MEELKNLTQQEQCNLLNDDPVLVCDQVFSV